MFDKLTAKELSILLDALTDYAVNLRTVRSPNQPDKLLAENIFLLEASQPRKDRYLCALGLRAEVRTSLDKKG